MHLIPLGQRFGQLAVQRRKANHKMQRSGESSAYPEKSFPLRRRTTKDTPRANRNHLEEAVGRNRKERKERRETKLEK